MAWDAFAARIVRQERLKPPRGEEILALVRAAVDDAMNSSTPLSDGLSAEVAGAVAAHHVLAKFLPGRQPALDARLEKSLALCPDRPSAEKAFEIGTAAAQAALAGNWKIEAPRPRLPDNLPAVTLPTVPGRTRISDPAPTTLRLHRDF